MKDTSLPDVSSFDFLTQQEKTFYAFALKQNLGQIAPDVAKKMLDLFESGKTCEDIRKLYPGFALGQIVATRIRDRWDQTKEERREGQNEAMMEQVMQAQANTAMVVANMLNAAALLYQDKINKFMVSRNPNDLKGTPLEDMSFKQFKDLLDTLHKATGQDKKKSVEIHGQVSHSMANRPLSRIESSNILDVLEAEESLALVRKSDTKK